MIVFQSKLLPLKSNTFKWVNSCITDGILPTGQENIVILCRTRSKWRLADLYYASPQKELLLKFRNLKSTRRPRSGDDRAPLNRLLSNRNTRNFFNSYKEGGTLPANWSNVNLCTSHIKFIPYYYPLVDSTIDSAPANSTALLWRQVCSHGCYCFPDTSSPDELTSWC